MLSISEAMQAVPFDIYLQHNVWFWKSMSSLLLITVMSLSSPLCKNSLWPSCHRGEPHTDTTCMEEQLQAWILWTARSEYFFPIVWYEWLKEYWTCIQYKIHEVCKKGISVTHIHLWGIYVTWPALFGHWITWASLTFTGIYLLINLRSETCKIYTGIIRGEYKTFYFLQLISPLTELLIQVLCSSVQLWFICGKIDFADIH